ncbi:MAG: TetR/AcrR family transcriptional regulator [bacterium]|nr:TetR/AcrR family transcriptional regulator [bacterium]
MARNKYPEETEKKIVDQAFELFVQKGYENTSVQDIINATGLSKGAIYHHFDSKESILLRVYDRINERKVAELMKIVHSDQMNGREKLESLFMDSFQDKERVDFMISLPNLLEQPYFLALHLKSTIKEIVPNFIYPVLKEGIEDGSIRCEHPLETAHAMMALSNVWMNPLIYCESGEKVENKVAIMYRILEGLGIRLQTPDFKKQMQDMVDLCKIDA